MKIEREVVWNLATITGANFVVRDGRIEGPSKLSSEQHLLLSNICQKSGLRLITADPCYIPAEDVTEQAAISIALVASREAARIARLEQSQKLLKQITWQPFEFDTDHKMLQAPGNEAPRSLLALKRQGIVDSTYILDHRDLMVVLDADPEKLKAFDATRKRIKFDKIEPGSTPPEQNPDQGQVRKKSTFEKIDPILPPDEPLPENTLDTVSSRIKTFSKGKRVL